MISNYGFHYGFHYGTHRIVVATTYDIWNPLYYLTVPALNMSHYGGTGGELIKHSTVATSEIKKTRSFGQETEVYPVVMDYRKIEPWLFVNFRCRAGKSDENC